ncbi:alpha/beta hydrolase [Lacticigenium naphthae]|uniref:alpha/beta hydrolase n=1 Tax=Lacticigenium naphthae TaxID=515351 RepID=UPI0003F5E626|nr:alpha/beta hydrolase [Lacticigenium naphthae]
MNTHLKKGLFTGGVLVAGSLSYAAHYFYSQAVGLGEKDFIESMEMENIYENDPWRQEKIWYREVEREVITIQSYDQLALSGIFVPPKKETNRYMIVAHGYTSSFKDMAPFVKLFHDLGYGVLVPDARGHGLSEGNYIGFGWHERLDYIRWISYLLNRFGEESQLALYGLSMGAATVLNVSGEKLPPQVKFIIEDCGYSSLSEEMAHQLKTLYHLPAFPIIPLTSALTKIRSGYFFREAAPLKQIKKNKLPTLFIHGEEDSFVPVHMSKKLYAANPSSKELHLFPEAKHAESYVSDKKRYKAIVESFISTYS